MPARNLIDTEDTLRHLYEVENLSCEEIGQRYGVTRRCVARRLKELGTDLDPSRYARSIKNTALPDDATLTSLYLELKLGFTEIGNRYGVSDAVVYRRVKKLGLFEKRKGIETNSKWHNLSRKGKEFKISTKRQRFIEEHGICQWCHQLIGSNFKDATYHHINLVCEEGSNDPSNCMVLHPECHGGSKGVPLNKVLHPNIIKNPGYHRPCYSCSVCKGPGARIPEGICYKCAKQARATFLKEQSIVLAEKGLDCRQIADELGVKDYTIEKYLGDQAPSSKNGLKRYRTTMQLTQQERVNLVKDTEHMSARAVALKYGTTHTTVLRLAKQVL